MYDKLVSYAAKQLELNPEDITPESTRMTAKVPNENTAFFLIEGFFFSLRLNNLNAIKSIFTIYKFR